MAQLCALADGLPLAIELMAARSRLMSPEMMLSRFATEAGTPRLDLLSQAQATLPGSHAARQRTLRETLDWSYRLLTSEEQRAFCRVALFRGGFALDAAEALLLDEEEQSKPVAWDLLGSLLDKHLLYQRAGANEGRFHMLETVHAYAREQLAASGQVEQLARRHAAHFCLLAETLGQQVHEGVDVEQWLDGVEIEYANFRVALQWAIEHNEGELAARTGR